MKEWILENTDVTEEEYDKLINPETITIEGVTTESNHTPNHYFEHPMLAIDLFTQNKPTTLRKLKYRVIKKKKTYIHKKIKFIILADLLKDMQEILFSINRKGKCFKLSSEILAQYGNTELLTAMCIDPFYKEPTPFLHSVIISKNNKNKEFILDATFNVAIEKETYLKLLQANIISTISREDFINIINMVSEQNLGKFIALQEYFCFPEQVTSAIKKLSKNNK